MEELNPLNWTAEPFLALYVVLAGSVLSLLSVWRNRLGPRPSAIPAHDPGELGVLHLGYLAGGAARAAGVALVGLLEAGAAVPDRKRGLIQFDPSTPVAAEFLPFRNVSGREADRDRFQAEFAFRWQRVHDELAQCGLVPEAAAVDRWRLQGAALLSAPLLLGACKVAVGLSRDRPVGILVVLLALTAVLGVSILATRPHRNLAGAATLAAAQRTHARAARAPLPDEMALAFALTGTSVLAGRDYRWALTSNGSNATSDGSSSSDGGGGDGGSGCGGCGH